MGRGLCIFLYQSLRIDALINTVYSFVDFGFRFTLFCRFDLCMLYVWCVAVALMLGNIVAGLRG